MFYQLYCIIISKGLNELFQSMLWAGLTVLVNDLLA